MMKKMFAVLLAALLTLTTAALAATYADGELAFEYDDAAFTISANDVGDDEQLVILDFNGAAWGEGYVTIHLRETEDGETFPTKQDFADIEEALGVTVVQGDWANFKDVFSYTFDDEDGSVLGVFIAPVYDDGGELEDILTVNISVAPLEDEAAGMARDDAISALVDSLKVAED